MVRLIKWYKRMKLSLLKVINPEKYDKDIILRKMTTDYKVKGHFVLPEQVKQQFRVKLNNGLTLWLSLDNMKGDYYYGTIQLSPYMRSSICYRYDGVPASDNNVPLLKTLHRYETILDPDIVEGYTVKEIIDYV